MCQYVLRLTVVQLVWSQSHVMTFDLVTRTYCVDDSEPQAQQPPSHFINRVQPAILSSGIQECISRVR